MRQTCRSLLCRDWTLSRGEIRRKTTRIFCHYETVCAELVSCHMQSMAASETPMRYLPWSVKQVWACVLRRMLRSSALGSQKLSTWVSETQHSPGKRQPSKTASCCEAVLVICTQHSALRKFRNSALTRRQPSRRASCCEVCLSPEMTLPISGRASTSSLAAVTPVLTFFSCNRKQARKGQNFDEDLVQWIESKIVHPGLQEP